MTVPIGTCRPAARRRTDLMGLVLGAALLVSASFTLGCSGEPTTITGTIGAPRPGNPGTSGSGATIGSRDSRLIGRWSRTVLFQDNIGAVHASRTSWRFGADAMATRAVVASNLTFGIVDSVVTGARWRTEGGAVVITYLPEGTGTARFEYFLQGTTLVLGGLAFERQ